MPDGAFAFNSYTLLEAGIVGASPPENHLPSQSRHPDGPDREGSPPSLGSSLLRPHEPGGAQRDPIKTFLADRCSVG